MRSLIVVAAIASLTAGAAFAQDAKQPATPPAAQATPAPTTSTSAVMTETQAKARIEAQGFSNVSELKKDEHGMWSAKAVKDGKPVQLSLDARGAVTPHN